MNISDRIATALDHHRSGRLQAAEQICRDILSLEPNQLDAWNLLGVICAQSGRSQGAVECFGRAVDLDPQQASCHSNLGLAFYALNKFDAAVACYHRALELNPNLTEVLFHLGKAHRELEQLEQAAECFERVLERKPDYRGAIHNLGIVRKEQGNLAAAEVCYRRVLAQWPDFAPSLHCLGNVLQARGEFEEAIQCQQRAIALDPDYADAHGNLGCALVVKGNMEQAARCLDRAVQLEPNSVDAHLNLALLWLAIGDYERGWPEYEWRWKTKKNPPRKFAQPRWDGSPLHGKTILMHAEQGLGDTIQFVRYAKVVKQQSGGRIAVQCQPALFRLLSRCRHIDELVDTITPDLEFDVHAPLLSLPGILKTNADTIPSDIPYVYADPDLEARWRGELSDLAGAKLKIGIVWQGNPDYPSDRIRSVHLRRFEPLARHDSVQLISLQKGKGIEQISEVAREFSVIDLGNRIDEESGAFMDTAAIIRSLDLVICVDTAPVHLAGALGVPVWLPMPFSSEWRWGLKRCDSPWYPTIRLFRQPTNGDWDAVFRAMNEALEELLANRNQVPQPLRRGVSG